ncbi:MAG: DUF2147 domain-containing protein [Pseudomonadota bacterium]
MKHAIAAALMLCAGAAMADPIVGTWKTQPDDGAFAHVQIAPCGAGYCGTIARTFTAEGEYNSPNKGKQIVRGMTPTSGGGYEGKVWRPSNDKIYLGKASVAGNSMQLRGCVAGGLFCSKQIWTRLN